MDVFSLLKIWQNAGVGDPINPADDEASFFDLVFTNPNNLQDTESVNVKVSNLDDVDLKSSHHTYNNSLSPQTTLNSSSNTKSPFRVLMLGLKPDKKEMKCQEIEEATTISTLLKGDNKLNHDHTQSKRFSKDLVHRYLNLIKPLYIKVSRRSNHKIRAPENSSFYTSPAVFSPRKESGRTVFKEVRKHLGKSRSSSVVKPIPSPAIRRDDSALQQQDAIQSAILHCKKSYNSPSQGCNLLSRSGSAPSAAGCRISIDEEKRSSI